MKKMSGREYTIRDIEALPAGVRAELIDGQMYLMASPGYRHQQILGKLYRIIADHIDKKGGPCEINLAPLAVYINNDEHNYVEPDLFVVCDRDKMDRKGCHGAPDWIIEIVSPGNDKMDRKIKLFKYRAAGVREYWIVDPELETVSVHNFEKGMEKEYSFQEKVPAGIYEDFAVKLA
ncbi:MAG: Uma2 family endonuclease [Roseburia sp.]|nr:Uma2 family endonuclease [Roseburia sp.]MCM1243128.1 Uma2 family endonuclease [Roseburia sp.]